MTEGVWGDLGGKPRNIGRRRFLLGALAAGTAALVGKRAWDNISDNLIRENYGREDMVFPGVLEVNLEGLNFRNDKTSDLEKPGLTIKDIVSINGVPVSNIKGNKFWLENPVASLGPGSTTRAPREDWIRLKIGTKDKNERDMYVNWGYGTEHHIKTHTPGHYIPAKDFQGETGKGLTIRPDIKSPEAGRPQPVK